MSDNEEWGEWQLHDGKGCPCVGEYVQAVDVNSLGREETFECVAGCRGGFSWDWKWAKIPIPGIQRIATRIIRYRIRKPRALLNLIERARELDDAPQGPVRAKPKVDA